MANQGTTAAGTQVIADKARELGIPVEGLTLVDGSGLDRGNRVSCRTLVSALALGARPELRAVWDGLAVAGQSGTLEDELRGVAAHGEAAGQDRLVAGRDRVGGAHRPGSSRVVRIPGQRQLRGERRAS